MLKSLYTIMVCLSCVIAILFVCTQCQVRTVAWLNFICLNTYIIKAFKPYFILCAILPNELRSQWWWYMVRMIAILVLGFILYFLLYHRMNYSFSMLVFLGNGEKIQFLAHLVYQPKSLIQSWIDRHVSSSLALSSVHSSPSTWLDMETSYLVYLCTYIPYVCAYQIFNDSNL